MSSSQRLTETVVREVQSLVGKKSIPELEGLIEKRLGPMPYVVVDKSEEWEI